MKSRLPLGWLCPTKVVGVGRVMAESEKRARQLGASAFAVDIVVGYNQKLC